MTCEEARYIGDKAGDYYGTMCDKAGEWIGDARDAASQKRGQSLAAFQADR